MYIPYGTQWIDEEDIKAVADALRGAYLTTGPRVEEFEKAVATYAGADYGVAVGNGTAALHIACMAAGLKEGDEVITTPLTFVASANCVLYCGATPVFADIDPITYNISPDSILTHITERTRAVIAVHYAGQPCDMEKISRIAKEHKLFVIEDSAHALGAEYKGKKIGGISDLTCFSFHPVKHITTGEGGMVTTNSKELYEKLKLLKSHGITRNEEWFENEGEGAWYYEQKELGYNYRISDIQCALGISQLKKLPEFLEKRRTIAEIYNDTFKEMENIQVPVQKEGCISSWHLYVIRVKPEMRRIVFNRLRRAEIGVNVHYIPVYRHPYYQKNGYADIRCENAENLYESIISLPIYPKMTNCQLQYVIDKVIEACN